MTQLLKRPIDPAAVRYYRSNVAPLGSEALRANGGAPFSVQGTTAGMGFPVGPVDRLFVTT